MTNTMYPYGAFHFMYLRLERLTYICFLYDSVQLLFDSRSLSTAGPYLTVNIKI
jgi:hypothetical protein